MDPGEAKLGLREDVSRRYTHSYMVGFRGHCDTGERERKNEKRRKRIRYESNDVHSSKEAR
jgi:hypothetical protein